MSAVWFFPSDVSEFFIIMNRSFYTDIFATRRIIYHNAPTTTRPAGPELGKFTKSTTYSPFPFRLIIKFIIFLLLNLIPVVGIPP